MRGAFLKAEIGELGHDPVRERIRHGEDLCEDVEGRPVGVPVLLEPYDPLKREVVCVMNLALMQGMVSGLRIRGVEAALDPRPGSCCVLFRRDDAL